MKFEKEATTKDGRRTWKITYELVRGPEPKKKQTTSARQPSHPASESQASRPATAAPEKAEPKKPKAKPKEAAGKQEKKKGTSSQLGFF